LKKLDGQTWTDAVHSNAGGLVRKRYIVRKLPQYLVFHLTRFTRNNFFVEKNPTIVTFPVKNLEMKDYLDSGDNINQMAQLYPEQINENASIVALKKLISKYGTLEDKRAATVVVEKPALVELARYK
jgi:hypothetical protein